MSAHNNERDHDACEMSPGVGWPPLRLAQLAQEATALWNASVPVWNEKPERKGKGRARRSPYSNALPETAAHLALDGQVRPGTDPRSTLFNTDGQIFSDAGV